VEKELFESRLKQYADFIIRVGTNVQPGQTLIINCSLEAAPLCRLCVRSALEAGARDVRVDWSDSEVARTRMELASEEALCDVKPYVLRSYLDYAESEGGVCLLRIYADDPEMYAGLDAGKINRVGVARRQATEEWRDYTMNDRIQWSIAAMPSKAWAKKIFPDLTEEVAIEKLWQLIFDVCRVTNGDPVNEWEAHLNRLSELRDKMNELDLESVHFRSSNGTDLTVGLAEGAHWESAVSKSERGVTFLPNIPTEEVFTAPHKDHVDGIVYGTKPYAYNGQLIKGFHVTFKDGKVIEHGAEENADLFAELLNTDEGARHIGEVALVPASSPINRSGALFYSTLFDENAACHIAFGASYPGTTKDGTKLTKEELLARGMNQSMLHEDVMIGAEDTEITGLCRDGRTVQIFKDGGWVL
jgi:aminopeptidase